MPNDGSAEERASPTPTLGHTAGPGRRKARLWLTGAMSRQDKAGGDDDTEAVQETGSRNGILAQRESGQCSEEICLAHAVQAPLCPGRDSQRSHSCKPDRAAFPPQILRGSPQNTRGPAQRKDSDSTQGSHAGEQGLECRTCIWETEGGIPLAPRTFPGWPWARRTL